MARRTSLLLSLLVGCGGTVLGAGGSAGGASGGSAGNGGNGGMAGQNPGGIGGTGGEGASPIGGTGGVPQPFCGDGVIDPGEQCDDGNGALGDGCAPDCNVECSCDAPGCPPFEQEAWALDPATLHCYRRLGSPTWTAPQESALDAETFCEGWGGTLAVLATVDEVDALASLGLSPPGEFWDYKIGAFDLEGDGLFEWVNGEPFTYVDGEGPWIYGDGGNLGPPGRVMEIWSETWGMGADFLVPSYSFLCERAPAGSGS